MVIPAGSPTATLELQVTNDTFPESAETISIRLGTPGNAIVSTRPGAATDHVISIGASDAPIVSFNIAQERVSEANSLSLTVSVTSAASYDITLPLTISEYSSATPGLDYTALPATITIPALTPSIAIPIQIANDSNFEFTETIVVRLGTGTGYTLGATPQATVSITDDDRVEASFATTSQTVWEDAGHATVTLKLSRASQVALSGSLYPIFSRPESHSTGFFSSGSSTVPMATSNKDFDLSGASFTIPGDGLTTSISVNVPIRNDPDHEPDEQFQLGFAGVPPGRNATHKITIDDDDPTVTLSVTKNKVNESDGSFTVTAHLSDKTNKPVSVRFTVTGNAASTKDSTLSTASPLIIDAGQQTANLVVSLVNDSAAEIPEYFNVTMGQVTNGIKGETTSQRIKIVDDDRPGIGFSTTETIVVAENETNAVVLSVPWLGRVPGCGRGHCRGRNGGARLRLRNRGLRRGVSPGTDHHSAHSQRRHHRQPHSYHREQFPSQCEQRGGTHAHQPTRRTPCGREDVPVRHYSGR